MTTVLKLGGSVLTRKDDPETVDWQALETATRAVSEHLSNTDDSLVLVHGGGSFGHPAAARHGVSDTVGTHDASAILDIHRAMGRLNEAVIDALQESEVSALPVRPLSLLRQTDRVDCPTQPVDAMLTEGFVPVLHGDVVVHEGRGATVLSGDALVVALARSLGATRVGVCSTVPGVFDSEGAVIPEITAFDEVADALDGSDSTDVTGGMVGKVQELLALEGTAAIFGLSALPTFLETGQAGTTIR